ncbi:MAG: hypothetical protein Q7S06_02280 [Nanoarchaeota archaeon]|nr:hypothetical protein [Nanoarchaeota archaeon]
MAKKMMVGKVLNFVAWLTGVLVSLAVGFAMTGGTLTVPWLDSLGASVVTMVAGWIVVIATLVSVVLAILKQ